MSLVRPLGFEPRTQALWGLRSNPWAKGAIRDWYHCLSRLPAYKTQCFIAFKLPIESFVPYNLDCKGTTLFVPLQIFLKLFNYFYSLTITLVFWTIQHHKVNPCWDFTQTQFKMIWSELIGVDAATFKGINTNVPWFKACWYCHRFNKWIWISLKLNMVMLCISWKWQAEQCCNKEKNFFHVYICFD